MAREKISLASQIAELEVSGPKDFDPEEDRRYESGSGSEAESSQDERAGTEHYEKVGKSKLRKPQEVALGPKYVGARVSRAAVFDENDDNDTEEDEEEESDETEGEEIGAESDTDEEDDGEGPFAELDDVDIGEGVGIADEDGDIDSDAAFGDSDENKFKNFTFRGSGTPRNVSSTKKRPTAADYMSDSEEDPTGKAGSEQDEADEDVLESESHENGDSEDEDDDEDVEMGGGFGGHDSDEEEEIDDIEEESESNPSQSDQGFDGVSNDEEDSSGEEGSDDEADQARRDELRQLMGEERHTVVAMSQAMKADAAKGEAVRAQRKAFDQLLHLRMDLQKAIIATNSLVAVEENQPSSPEAAVYEAAEEAALKLWTTLDDLRQSLAKSSGSKSRQKRKREVDQHTDSSVLWDRMQAHEVTMLDTRQSTLDKWSAKVRSTDAQPVSRKLGPSTTHQQPLSTLLGDQLATSSEHLIARTQIPRSCAPVQRDAKVTSHPSIFDDGPFYQLLLKELVDQRRVESLGGGASDGTSGVMGWTAVKDVKARKVVDTKASKGRKLRYNVHEKLQNFMAREDRRTWEEGAITRFFGTLLGQKMNLAEEEGSEDDGNGDVDAEAEGLKLFRS